MRWNIHNEYINSIPKKELSQKIEKKGLTRFIIDTIINNSEKDDTITFFANDKNFIEKIVKKIVCLCHCKGFVFGTATENHKCIYKNNHININKLEGKYWYFTFSKVSFNTENKSITSYYFNFINKNKNYNLNLILDEDMN